MKSAVRRVMSLLGASSTARNLDHGYSATILVGGSFYSIPDTPRLRVAFLVLRRPLNRMCIQSCLGAPVFDFWRDRHTRHLFPEQKFTSIFGKVGA